MFEHNVSKIVRKKNGIYTKKQDLVGEFEFGNKY